MQSALHDPASTPAAPSSRGGVHPAVPIVSVAAVVGIAIGLGAAALHRSSSQEPAALTSSQSQSLPSGTGASPNGTASSAAGSSTPSAAASRPSTGPSKPAGPITGTRDADPGKAAAALASGKVAVTGDPVASWQWTDSAGRNILLMTRSKDAAPAGFQAATLRVYHVVQTGSGYTVLRTLNDNGGGPCDLEFGLRFVLDTVTVADHDGDGRGEATVGWTSTCRGDVGPASLKLALLQGGQYFILRGEGLVKADRVNLDATNPSISGLIPKGHFAPSPATSNWPRNSYQATVDIWNRIYS